MTRVLALALAGMASYCLAGSPAPIRPDPAITPGATVDVPLARLCLRGYASSVRHVTEAEKRDVFSRYGIDLERRANFEVDHLISLELGGSNDERNLWPESYVTRPWNAHRKDALEDRLHALVCAKKLTLAEAQQAIRTDWTAAYRKYVGEP